MSDWLHDPFKAVILGTILLIAVGGALSGGMSLVDLFV
jgi:hypothetical protein